MIRPLNVLLSGITVFIATYLLDVIDYNMTLYIAIVVMLFCSFANIINDLFDTHTDAINSPKKYLQTLLLTGPYTVIILFIILIFSFFLSYLYFSINAQYYLGVIFFLIVIYTPYLKGIPIIGNIAVSFIVASVFIFTELTLTKAFSCILFYPSILTFLLTLIREIFKDIDDIKGDQKVGINTFPVRFGIYYSKYLLLFLIILLIIVSIYPYWINIYNFNYLIFLVLFVQIPLVGCIFYLWKYPNSQSCSILTIATKYITIGGVITILSTRLFA